MAHNFPAATFRFIPSNDAIANLKTGVDVGSLAIVMDNTGTPPSGLVYAYANMPNPTVANEELSTIKIEDEVILCVSRSGDTITVYDENTDGYSILAAGENGRGYAGTTATTHVANKTVYHVIDESILSEIQDAIEANTAAIATKAAESAVIKKDGSVAFTADQSMGTHKITDIAAPVGANDAARKADVDGLDFTLYAHKDGSVAFTGNQSMGNHKLTNVTDPAAAQDAATKNYIDTNFAGVATGHASRAQASGSGTQVITHGIGRTPKLIKITAASAFSCMAGSWGTATSISDSKCIYAQGDSAATYKDNQMGYNSTEILYTKDNDGGFPDIWEAHVSAITTTTFTLTFTMTGNPATINFLWEVFA